MGNTALGDIGNVGLYDYHRMERARCALVCLLYRGSKASGRVSANECHTGATFGVGMTNRQSEFASVPDGAGGTRVEPEYRIVSRPNGLWCAQVRMVEKGTRDIDNWYDIAGNMPKEAAESVITTWAFTKRSVDLSTLDGSPDFRAWLVREGRRGTVLDRCKYMQTL